MVSALVSANWLLPGGKFEQPEDNLLDYIRQNPEVQKRRDQIDPKHNIPPNQWHELLCLGNQPLAEHEENQVALESLTRRCGKNG
jgi:hypothetical protein